MGNITVSLPIVVPSGKYCWRYDGSHAPCVHFDNEFCRPGECTILKQDLEADMIGVLKCVDCVELKEIDT